VGSPSCKLNDLKTTVGFVPAWPVRSQAYDTDVKTPSLGDKLIRYFDDDSRQQGIFLESAKLGTVGSLATSKDSDPNKLFQVSAKSISSDSQQDFILGTVYQRTSGPIPRSYLPSLLVLSDVSKQEANANPDRESVLSVTEELLRWYLDAGGRLARLQVAASNSLVSFLTSAGFTESEGGDAASSEVVALKGAYAAGDFTLLAASAKNIIEHCTKRVTAKQGDAAVLYDILGRLSHDIGNPKDAIAHYTSSLQANANSAATFRNLGAAYHGNGDVQLAFASYQQALQLNSQGKEVLSS
jgi:tetratricopeptide (TPR) repeat protein